MCGAPWAGGRDGGSATVGGETRLSLHQAASSRSLRLRACGETRHSGHAPPRARSGLTVGAQCQIVSVSNHLELRVSRTRLASNWVAQTRCSKLLQASRIVIGSITLTKLSTRPSPSIEEPATSELRPPLPPPVRNVRRIACRRCYL